MKYRELRDLTRARTIATRDRTREIQRLEKFLEDSGIKLSSVVSDLTGVSSRAMLEALVSGERDPQGLASLAKGTLGSRPPEVVDALTGGFREHHAFMAGCIWTRSMPTRPLSMPSPDESRRR